MRPWWRRDVSTDRPARWAGTALLDAAAKFGVGDVAYDREVAFAVAQAARDGDSHALRALAGLLTRSRVSDEGTLANLVSALQFASMLPESARADWVPPAAAVARTVEIGLGSQGPLAEQTDGLLWALVNRRLAADWLGYDGGNAVAAQVASSDLRQELLRQLRASSRLIDLVAGGEEFPCVLA